MNIFHFRRFQAHKNRFVYQDTRSWRGYYDSHVGGKCIGDRTDEMDRFLGPWEMFTGKFDKHGNPIYVGDIVKYPVEGFDPFIDWIEAHFFDIVWDDNEKSIFGKEDDVKYFLSEIEWDKCEIVGNIHQERS
jgi:hypothetical protein